MQGVGFRMTARDCARAAPVTGWVRNEPNGSVAMEIQGAPAEVDRVLADLRDRMAGNLERVERREIEPLDHEDAFRIER